MRIFRCGEPALHGFVDEVRDGRVAGWCTAPRVVVSRNGEPLITLRCDGERPDVAATGVAADAGVGFQAALRLTSGDIVRVTSEGGWPLRHSPWCYLAEQDREGLPAAVAWHHPEYADIAALHRRVPFVRFRPLFGRLGQVSAVLLVCAGEKRPRVARLAVPRREARRLTRLHHELLEPAGVACAGLREVLACQALGSEPLGVGRRRVLVFDVAAGTPLDQYGAGWENWLPAVANELSRLVALGATQGRWRRWRLAGSKPSLMGRLLREALGDALRLRDGVSESRFLGWLVMTLLRLPRVLSHGDLHRENVMVDAATGGITLIDWDRAGYLPLGFDLALLMRGLPGEKAERLTGGSRAQRLGVVGFSYLFQRLDRPGFVGSQQARALQRRCRELAGALSTQAE